MTRKSKKTVPRVEITEEQLIILRLLDKAPRLEKNPYYVAGKLNVGYDGVYRKVKVLAALGFIHIHKSETGKVSYIPNQEVLEKTKDIKIK